ncbi:MAG TPA: redoxin domain-containing protein [Planctomycetaceae bacterium]|jgi:peroxiredoxin/mono/diheme cytochrome c family protein|nr:redoxin domain-containing protein [Planctomycetaceae bacterium]
MKKQIGFALLALAGVPCNGVAERPTGQKIAPAIAFSLKDVGRHDVALSDFRDKKAVVVVFTGIECPVSNYYVPRLKELSKAYAAKGVLFLAVNSNAQDSLADVADHARQQGLPFPALKDADQKVLELLRAERTPEVVLLDSNRTIRYRGRIDDQFGVGFRRPQPSRCDLAQALDEVLARKPVSVARTQAAGCRIARQNKPVATGKITYTNQIARLFQRNCQECHRPGEIGPFSLLTYSQAKGWADMIHETVDSGRMPPWYAGPHYGKFANDRRLSKEDKETLLAWIDQGCPRGDDKDLPQPKGWHEGWWIGKPDVVISMDKDFTVPADGGKDGVPYQYFTVPTNFTEDRWVQAAEARPGNRAVVHHIIAFVSEPGEAGGPRRGGAGSYLVGVAPGEEGLVLPPGMGKKIPKGASITFQMHYTSNGVKQKDRSSLGLIFCKEPPKQLVRTAAITQAQFAIPPGDGNYKVKSTAKYDKEIVILSFMPHMHLRGKDFEYRVEYPNGRSEVLLSVPRYDFAWQMRYVLADPLRLPAGSKIVCTAHFDNSRNNPNNPDPTRTVTWGQQTWDEMMIGWMQYYHPTEKIESQQVSNGGKGK